MNGRVPGGRDPSFGAERDTSRPPGFGGSPTSLDLFAGMGGASLGLRAAGCRHLACVDNDCNAVAALEASGFPAVRADLASWVWRGERPDLVWASPPCQPWSTAGSKLGDDDDRDGWPLLLRLCAEVRPTWVVAENVAGMVDLLESRTYVEEVLVPRLRALYPCVSWAVLDAAHYGLPQTRRRLFVAAGPRAIRFPAPTHGDTSQLSMFRQVAPLRTLGEALAACAEPHPGPSYPAGTGRAASEPWRLAIPSPTVTTAEVRGTRAYAGADWSFHGGPDRASDAVFLATGRRRLSWRECAVLQGLPVEPLLAVPTVDARYRLVGNAVPPALACALVRSLLDL